MDPARGGALANDVDAGLVRTLYSGMPQIVAICVAVLVSSIALGLHLKDPVFLWIATVSTVTTSARAGLYLAFRRHGDKPLSALGAGRWTAAYGIVAIGFAANMSVLILHALRTGDIGAGFVVANLAVLYSSQIARSSSRPWIGLTNGAMITLAFLTGIGTRNSPVYWGLAVFLSLYFLAYAKSVLAYQKTMVQRLDARRDVEYLAHHDSLTGLANRSHFSDLLAGAIGRAESGKQLGLHFIDLDRFKLVNDSHGHKGGDDLLRAVAQRLQLACEAQMAGGALAARIGGDEFIVMQPDLDSDIAAAAFAEQLCQALAEVGKPYGVTASIGMALYPADAADADELIRNADIALYEAKAAGRSTFRSYDVAAAERLREYQTLQHDLRETVAKQGLTLVYQPQARTSDGECLGFEVLVRWTHPTFGPIGPDRFIPMAEEAGVIGALGAWVLEASCREAATWDPALSLAVNLSPMQIVSGDLPALVADILKDTGMDPARLELEITEGIFIQDTVRTLAVLTAIKAMGVRIAMDDFGTGYSSLSYLQAFPFDRIKIDRSFIADLENSKHSRAIVRAVTSLGKGLGIPVLAEGVETEIQRALLLQEGCHEFQGYLLSRPAAIETFDAITQGPAAEAGAPRRAAV